MSSEYDDLLETLRTYMEKMYPEWKSKGGFPLKFWELEDPELFYEVLSYFPLQFASDDPFGLMEDFPEGFRIAFPIFWLEDDYAFNGWTALTNASEWVLPKAVEAFRTLGMEEEAAALHAAQRALIEDPGNTDAAEAAYKSVRNPYKNERKKTDKILEYFWRNRKMFQEVKAGDA